MAAVREIQPANVDAGMNELFDDRFRTARRSNRGDNLRVTHQPTAYIGRLGEYNRARAIAADDRGDRSKQQMSKIVPNAVENYLAALNRAPDALLALIAAEGRGRGLPIIDAEVGTLLRVQAMAIGARRILEIGTAIGYSGIWLAGALPPDGVLITMEIDPDRAEQARQNFARAGLSDRANVMVGDVNRMLHKVAGPFDLIFQDGKKDLYGPLLDKLIELLRPGGLLITDNVLWAGEVVPGLLPRAERDPEGTRAIAEYNERLSIDGRLLTTWLPLRDGVSISVKR